MDWLTPSSWVSSCWDQPGVIVIVLALCWNAAGLLRPRLMSPQIFLDPEPLLVCHVSVVRLWMTVSLPVLATRAPSASCARCQAAEPPAVLFPALLR
jgi:hypothetical protein